MVRNPKDCSYSTALRILIGSYQILFQFITRILSETIVTFLDLREVYR